MSDLLLELRKFTGSETFYYHPLFRKYVYTEGVRHLALKAGAFWLLEHIFAHQYDPKIKGESFQTWTITVHEGNSASIQVEDGDKNKIKCFELTYTDFPLPEFTLWFIDRTLLLPSEY